MDDAKRRALIKFKAAKKKEAGDVAPTGTGPSILSIKRKPLPKGDRPAKKAKVPLEPIVGLMVEAAKTATPAKHGVGKGLMKGPSTNQEKPPILLREDSKHALKQILSIISPEDYEDLGNHFMEAIGETDLFAITQVTQPVTFIIVLYFCFRSNSPFFISGNGYDERADGTMSQPRDDPGTCTGEDRADGG